MLRLIGDIHGTNNWHQYRQITEDCEFSVQLGDMGFGGMYDMLNKHIDPLYHRFIPGNHDNYDLLPAHSFSGDWGSDEINGVKFFWIRGAKSIDWYMRIQGVSIWDNEEISWSSGQAMVKEFVKVKPDIVLSHDCPSQVHPYVISNRWKVNKSLTVQILEEAFSQHQPKIWVFGHHHVDWTGIDNNTRFICLDERSYVDVDSFGQVVHTGTQK